MRECNKCSKEKLGVEKTKGKTTMQTPNKNGKYTVINSGALYEIRTVDGPYQLCYECMKKHQNQQNKILNELKQTGKAFKNSDYKLKLDDF
jgi:hypothetical protein